MARLTTCLAILVVISVILQQQPVTGFSRPFRSFLKAQSRDLDEDQDEAHDEYHDVADEEMVDRGLSCWVARLNQPIWCDHSEVCDDCKPYVWIGFGTHCGIGCDAKGYHCERCRKRFD